MRHLLALVITALALWLPDQPGHCAPVNAIVTLIRHSGALPDTEIRKLANIASQKGPREVGKLLGDQNLPRTVLADAYLRIAIQRGVLERAEAQRLIDRLSDVPGFTSTLSKVIGNNPNGTAGHLNELRIAAMARDHQMDVLEISRKFDDPFKGAPTDIDIVLSTRRTQVAIEAKDYASTTAINLIDFRADMVSLAEYARANREKNVLTVFTMTRTPDDPGIVKRLNMSARQNGVELIFGTPEEQLHQIEQLVRLK